MKKTIVFASVVASALALATLSYAATDTDPNAPAAVTQAASKIGMADALEAAKAKYPDAEALSATLHGTRSYGLVWDVRMEGKYGGPRLRESGRRHGPRLERHRHPQRRPFRTRSGLRSRHGHEPRLPAHG